MLGLRPRKNYSNGKINIWAERRRSKQTISIINQSRPKIPVDTIFGFHFTSSAFIKLKRKTRIHISRIPNLVRCSGTNHIFFILCLSNRKGKQKSKPTLWKFIWHILHTLSIMYRTLKRYWINEWIELHRTELLEEKPMSMWFTLVQLVV